MLWKGVKMNEEATRKLQEDAFWLSPLDKEEQWDEDHAEGFVPCDNQDELRESLMKAAQNTQEARKKRPVTINLDGDVVAYFKQLALETGIAYQSLINLFLVQCAKEKKRPMFV